MQAGTIQQVVLPAQAGREVPVPRQLPPVVRDFTGREGELAVLDGVLPEVGGPAGAAAVAVVDGVGGAGKTTLVVQWAHRVQDRFGDGTLFVNLRGVGPSAPLDPAVVLTLFLPALGLAEVQVPAEFEAQVGLYRSVLAERRVLVVLDNAADAEQVRPLLPGAPGCVVVVTGRGGLTELVIAEAAHRISINVFTAIEAESLLRGILGAERIDAEPGAVAELIAVCGGLPLAVRVAATRVAARPHFDIADVVAEITEDYGQGGEDAWGGDVVGAVRSVFDWSYTQLTGEQGMVFRRLGLHPGPEFGVPAVAALTELDPGVAYRCLEVLADLHQVEPVGRKRYRMHDLMHAYAAYRIELDETPDNRRAVVVRVLAWYAHTAQQADQAVFPALSGVTPDEVGSVGVEVSFADRDQARHWLHGEHANLVAAVRRAVEGALHELAMALAVSCRFLTTGGNTWFALHLEATELGVASARAVRNQAVEALLLSMRTDTLCRLERWDDAEAAITRTLVLAEELDDPARQVSGLSGLGRVRRGQGRLREAGEYYQRSGSLARDTGQTRSEAVALCHLSGISAQLGEFEDALEYAEQELVLRRQAGDRIGEAGALCDAALAWQGLGRHETAITLCRQAIASYQGLGYAGVDLVETVLALATSLEHIRDWTAAVETMRAAVALLTNLEDPRAEQTRQRLTDLEARIAGDQRR